MYANGTSLRDYTQLGSILSSTASTYKDEGGKVAAAMDSFINKYSKLAVKVNISGISATVKKVPGKNIYFVDGSMTISNSFSSTPFTIVQTNGNTTIKGNINNNMMLLSKGIITFDAEEFSKCSDTQVVKGIFYTTKNFASTGVNKNTNLNNSKWCIGGNLHIKGIAIGNGLDEVMAERRSNLNEWFRCSDNSLTCKTTRRNYVMKGASLLIEYAPSIFTKSTMPPGAEEFTTALEVYRK